MTPSTDDVVEVQQVPEDEAWEKAHAYLRERDETRGRAEELFRRAAERRLELTVLGMTVTTRWPSTRRMVRVGQEIERLANLDPDDEADVELADEMAQRFATEASRLLINPTISVEDFLRDDYGLELAIEIIKAASDAVQEANDTAGKFRADDAR